MFHTIAEASSIILNLHQKIFADAKIFELERLLRIFVLTQSVLSIILFNLVAPLATNQDTNYRNHMSTKKRLVITLRYLAEGSQQGCIFTNSDNLSQFLKGAIAAAVQKQV